MTMEIVEETGENGVQVERVIEIETLDSTVNGFIFESSSESSESKQLLASIFADLAIFGEEEGENDDERPENDDSLTVQEDYSRFDDSDIDDDNRALFPCPFCYVDIEIPVLCSHLQEEHCFDLKNAVCPLCAANLGKDAIGHFINQHSSSLKRRRKFEKPSILAGSSTPGKRSPANSRGNKHETLPDPLLSPFICNSSLSSCYSDERDDYSSNDLSVVSDTKSCADEQDGDNEVDHQVRKQRAAFVQDLFASTIL